MTPRRTCWVSVVIPFPRPETDLYCLMKSTFVLKFSFQVMSEPQAVRSNKMREARG